MGWRKREVDRVDLCLQGVPGVQRPFYRFSRDAGPCRKAVVEMNTRQREIQVLQLLALRMICQRRQQTDEPYDFGRFKHAAGAENIQHRQAGYVFLDQKRAVRHRLQRINFAKEGMGRGARDLHCSLQRSYAFPVRHIIGTENQDINTSLAAQIVGEETATLTSFGQLLEKLVILGEKGANTRKMACSRCK